MFSLILTEFRIDVTPSPLCFFGYTKQACIDFWLFFSLIKTRASSKFHYTLLKDIIIDLH